MSPSTLRAQVPVVDAATMLAASDATVIDLRSPGEFGEDHVPGAVNVPLFDDTERALIGTLYARTSPAAAFDAARGRTVAKIEALVAAIADHARWAVPAVDLAERVAAMTAGGIGTLERELTVQRADVPERPVVLHCWRGGLRSRSVVALLRGLGLERAVGVAGGYKEYRRQVMEELAAWRAPATFVLRGLTGVGKTLVLRALEGIRPRWTLDLEGLAGHRSSILGMVGLEPCSQRTFDSRLRARLSAGFPGPCVIEGESRKVGDVVVPVSVWKALQSGTNVQLVAPLERRIEVLRCDYLGHTENRTKLAEQLPFIEERLGARKWKGELVRLLDTDRIDELVATLLELYYDPLYLHSETGRRYVQRVDASDPERAAAEVAAIVDEAS